MKLLQQVTHAFSFVQVTASRNAFFLNCSVGNDECLSYGGFCSNTEKSIIAIYSLFTVFKAGILIMCLYEIIMLNVM